MIQCVINRFSRWLVSRRLPVVLALVAFLLTSTSIPTGLQFDDYFHQMQFQRPERYPNPLITLFTFAVSTPFKNDFYMQLGMTPWWTFEGLKISLFRPLTAITHWLDYHLWPDSPAVMHVHNLLWLAGMVFFAALIYRLIGPSAWIAGLAALLYAIDDAHGTPAGWIANRNALMATVFGFCCLYCHIRWRREKWKMGAVFAWVCFIMGLLCGETALAIGAYLFSYELFLSSDQWRKRITAGLPYAVVVMAYLITYHIGGFGAHGSGAYVDPGRNPLLFFRLLFERIPLLLYGQWLFPNSAIYGFLSKSIMPVALIVIYILLAIIFFLFLPLLKRDAVSRFWALGMMLSLLPFSAASPANRLLIIPGLGAMGLLSQFFAAWREKSARIIPAVGMRRRIAKAFLIIFIVVHGVLAPAMLPIQALSKDMGTKRVLENYAALSDYADLKDKTLVLINPPFPMLVSYFHFICEKNGLDIPKQARVLATGLTSSLDIQRIDSQTIEIERDEGFISQDMDKLFRSSETPMRVGQRVDLGDMRAEVLSLTPDQRPLRVRFSFSKPLEDPSMAFYIWQGEQCEPFALPEPGQSIKVASLMRGRLYGRSKKE